MATSLGIITILGMTANYLMEKVKIPGLLGMLLVGVLLGPGGFDFISPDLMRVSADFREIALIIILLRAGLGLDWGGVEKGGKACPGLELYSRCT